MITAFWGLESDFGAGQGKDHSIKSLATLAYDCRRSDMFRGHLFDSLRLIERGDLRPEEMIGSWAGELGQTQIMPSEYMAHAIDYDGDGKRNLIKSVPDVIGSTGKYLVHLGWKRGEPWLQEVRVPGNLPWKEADLSVQHPRSQWAAWGVTRADGKPLPSDNMTASLVLPIGRFGPAFLAYDNFQAYLKWNQSLNYSLTAGYYATRLDGAPVDEPRQRRRFRRSPSTRPASCRSCCRSAATTSAASTACSASRAASRSARCRSSSACRRTAGRPRNCSRGCAAFRADDSILRGSELTRFETKRFRRTERLRHRVDRWCLSFCLNRRSSSVRFPQQTPAAIHCATISRPHASIGGPRGRAVR